MKKILAVDDEPTNLQLLRQILRDHYQMVFATSGEKALEALSKHIPDLILLDIMMPGMSGYEVCRKIKANPVTNHIPVIFISAMSDIYDESTGFDAGCVDYIQKPISSALLLRRIQTHLSLVTINELEKIQKDAIYMLGEAGHYNDTDTGLHIWRMAAYSRALAAAAGWHKSPLEMLELAASTHDTGKIGIPDHILKANRALDSQEWELMKQHTKIGFNILIKSNQQIFRMAAEIALRHHEKWNGEGYPDGIAGEDIPESARIVAIADVFDALTTKRPYKEPWTTEAAKAEIIKSSGKHFEPRLTAIFEKIFPQLLEIKHIFEQRGQAD